MKPQQSSHQRIGPIVAAVFFAWSYVSAVYAVSTPAAVAEGEPKRDASAAPVQVVLDVSYGPDARNVLDLHLPQAGPKPRPLVLCIHGGGWAGGDKRSYAWLADALARKGYVAASVTYRSRPRLHRQRHQQVRQGGTRRGDHVLRQSLDERRGRRGDSAEGSMSLLFARA
jgi:acetyl esterase/lipase